MSEKKIFFSYSRDDSEFVLNLAKELRADGADIWLDQLDIKPGTRWDKSIEDALDASQTVLVILSKTSVASNNVMDEVSYALEEGKTVLPVLLEECDIPFRLRRLQFADFSVSHEKGIQTLTKALGLTDKAAVKPKQVVDTPKEPITEPQIVKEKPSTPKDTERVSDAQQTTPKKSKLPLYIVAVIAAVFGFMFATGVFNKADKSETKKGTTEIVQEEKQVDMGTIKEELKAISKRIKFEPGADRLGDVDKELDRLADLLNKYPSLSLNIDCHVHDQGTRLRNATLSRTRAAVLQKMMETRGIAPSRINSQGYGESKAMVSNNTREGMTTNTRVEMTFSRS